MAQSFTASLRKSPVFDEPPHIASGLAYLEKGIFQPNLQHPPLLKELSAIFLAAAGIHWPNSEIAQALVRGGPQADKLEWQVGIDLIHDDGVDRVMFWARMPFILLGGLLGFLIYWWGRELVGDEAALGALFLYAFDPTMIAHSALVTTDLGLAAFTMLFLFTLWRYLQAPDWKRLVVCGVALGAVLGAKFSAIFLLPVAVLIVAAEAKWPLIARATPTEPAPAAAAKVGPNAPCPCGSGKKFKKCHGAGSGSAASPHDVGRGIVQRQALRNLGAFAAMFVVAAVVIEILYRFPSDPFLYVAGVKKVNADHVVGYQAYLHGELAKHFYSYFVEAFLLKEPLATVLLSLAGLVLFLRSKLAPMVKLFVLLPAVVMVAAPSVLADNMGIRYIIPAMPFAYLLGGVALAALFAKREAWGRIAGAAACLWVVVAAAGIYPDDLSYFNESACLLESPGKLGFDGGTRCGPAWLDDSNVDWGQGMKQLRAWTDANAKGRKVRLIYFGSYPPDAYGRFDRVGPAELVQPAPGLYAISANFVARLPALGVAYSSGAAGWLRTMKPVAIVGHAFYIYDVH